MEFETFETLLKQNALIIEFGLELKSGNIRIIPSLVVVELTSLSFSFSTLSLHLWKA
jgi:hypothetical protein